MPDAVIRVASSDHQRVDAEFHHPVLDMVVPRLGIPLGEIAGVRRRVVSQRAAEGGEPVVPGGRRDLAEAADPLAPLVHPGIGSENGRSWQLYVTSILVKDRPMDETKNLSETEALQTPGDSSIGSPDETKDTPGTDGSRPRVEVSSGSSNGDPTKIGRYRIVRRLGQGGFGRVYLAHDDDLDRPVAIKVPNPERIARPRGRGGFLNEARILARLDHPHIVPVYDVGRTEDGLCFVVSKIHRRQRLGGQIGRARPSLRDSAELVATIANAMQYAHTEDWFIGTSSLPTYSSTPRVNHISPISGWLSRTRISARVGDWLELRLHEPGTSQR